MNFVEYIILCVDSSSTKVDHPMIKAERLILLNNISKFEGTLHLQAYIYKYRCKHVEFDTCIIVGVVLGFCCL